MLNRALRLLAELHEPPPAAPPPKHSAIVVPLVAALVLIVSHYNGHPDFWREHLQRFMPSYTKVAPVADHLYWFYASLVLYMAVPLFVLWRMREPLDEYGLGLGDWKLGLKISGLLLAVMLPIVAIASRTQTFSSQYPLAQSATKGWLVFGVYELGYALYFVAWEFLFRSFLLRGLHRHIGFHAIYAQTVPFALLHVGKPQAEALGSIIAGVALGLLALRTRSFWWGALVHITVAVTMDVLSAWSKLPRLW
jgi:uncharacterized protein